MWLCGVSMYCPLIHCFNDITLLGVCLGKCQGKNFFIPVFFLYYSSVHQEARDYIQQLTYNRLTKKPRGSVNTR